MVDSLELGLTPGEPTVSPAGNVTTGTIGAVSPPVPWKCSAIATFVSHPSLPGTENFWSSALVAELAEAIPTTVSDDPEERDDALVGEDPTGYRGHGLPPRIVAKINDL